jgi:transposase
LGISSTTSLRRTAEVDPILYRQRHRIENMFGKLEDWHRIHTCYGRCAHTFMFAIALAATVIFWLPQ